MWPVVQLRGKYEIIQNKKNKFTDQQKLCDVTTQGKKKMHKHGSRPKLMFCLSSSTHPNFLTYSKQPMRTSWQTAVLRQRGRKKWTLSRQEMYTRLIETKILIKSQFSRQDLVKQYFYYGVVLTSGWAEGNQIRTLEHAYQRSRLLLHQCPQMQKGLLSCTGKILTSLHCPQICRQNSKNIETDNIICINQILANYTTHSFLD